MLKDRALILKTYKHSEANLIVHALNNRGIKLKLMAPSALLSKKRFGGGVLQPTHYVQLTYKPARLEDGLGTLQEAQLIEDFEQLRSDYDRLQLALHFLNLVDRVSQEGESFSEALFDLLGNGLKAIRNSQHLEILRTQFELKLLQSQGVLQIDSKMLEFLKTPLSKHSELSHSEHLSFLTTFSRLNLGHYLGTV